MSKTFSKDGYEWECEQGGQERRYGPSVYRYCVRDLQGGRSKEEVRAFCVTQVQAADDPKTHDLRTHFKGLREIEPGIWLYTCGHDYTG